MDPTLRDGARFQGVLTGLPYGSSSRAVFYNQPAWDAAGITTPPDDWAEFLEAARAMKAGGVEIPFFYEGKGQEAMAAWFPYVYFTIRWRARATRRQARARPGSLRRRASPCGTP